MSHVEEHCAETADLAGFSPPAAGSLATRLANMLLAGIGYGRLRVVLPNGSSIERVGAAGGPDATVVVHRWRALRRLAWGGDVGFAEAFVDGDWTSPDLTSVVRLGARNADHFARATGGSRLVRLANRLRHVANANTLSGSRRNIPAHYDLGNDFYRLWLDPSMLYSSAMWDETTPDLEAAQRRKLARVVELLAIAGGEKVLEIGCGWGALAARLAQSGAGEVTGVTLSPAQLAFARDEIARRGLDGRVRLGIEDYRDIAGSFDRVVSIEMLEAVGEAYWPQYFAKIAAVLAPGGRAVLQVITIAEQRYEAYRRTPDFIQKHVFPGGFLPSPAALAGAVAGARLRIVASETFGRSYAATLAEWRRRFDAHRDEIEALGFDQRFRRLWTYYLCYCEAGFLEGAVDVGLYVIEHAGRE